MPIPQSLPLVWLLAFLAAFLSASGAWAQAFETRAAQAFLIDAETESVLFAKDADKLIPPASLAKLMTMEVVFEAIESGRHALGDEFIISENAWRNGGAPSGGSTMFAKLNSKVRLEDLIQGVVVQSANDGCIAIAEGFSGSEAEFAAMMTERAREIGLEASVFRNSTGLPADGQVVTVRELVRLGMHIWREHPDFYRYYGQPEFTWNEITQKNRNPLLAMNIGADGMMTGFTEESGYAILGSATRNGRRVFAAMSGMASEKERADEARKLIEWGLGEFGETRLFEKDQVVGVAELYGGAKAGVAVKAKGPVTALLPRSGGAGLAARIVYDGPVAAPVETGAPVGTLQVWVGDTLSQQVPLFAAESVGPGSLHQRAADALAELLVGWLR